MARDSKADQMYSVLREEILTGGLRPGDSLSVLKIADRFGASRTPVRDAFIRLESEGLVSLIDRQGARVSPISIRGVRDLFEIRIMLEGQATRQVAETADQDAKVRGAFSDLADHSRPSAPNSRHPSAGSASTNSPKPTTRRSSPIHATSTSHGWSLNYAPQCPASDHRPLPA